MSIIPVGCFFSTASVPTLRDFYRAVRSTSLGQAISLTVWGIIPTKLAVQLTCEEMLSLPLSTPWYTQVLVPFPLQLPVFTAATM